LVLEKSIGNETRPGRKRKKGGQEGIKRRKDLKSSKDKTKPATHGPTDSGKKEDHHLRPAGQRELKKKRDKRGEKEIGGEPL